MEGLVELYLHGNKNIKCIPTSFKHLTNLNEFTFDWYFYFTSEYNPLPDNLLTLTFSLCSQHTHIGFHSFFTYLIKNINNTQPFLLHLSCKLGHYFITQYFLDNGYDPNELDAGNNTALNIAVVNKNEKCVKVLFESLKLNVSVRSDGLLTAISTRQFNLVEFMLKNESLDVSISDTNDNSPLHLLFEMFDSSPTLAYTCKNFKDL